MRWVLVAAAVAGTLAAGTLVGVRIWAEHYAPLRSAGFFGPAVSSDRYLGPSGGDTRYMHDTEGHATTWVMGIRNDGGTAITIDAAEPLDVAGHATWSPYVVVPDGAVSGQPGTPHPWPAHVAGHKAIRLRVTLDAAQCQGRHAVLFDAVQLRWHVLGVHHSQAIPTLQTVQICPTTTSTKEWVSTIPSDAMPQP